MPDPASQKTITYLAYLEEMATMYPDTAVEAPGLGALRPRPFILGGKFVRARFSGIRASLFDEMKDAVGLARDGVLSAYQRQQRRTALQEAFQRFPIPVIDLFWSGDDAAARSRRERTMRLHHWFQLELLPGAAEGAREPVFMGEPDAGRPAEPEFEAGQLLGLRALSAREEEPLRDIFSLAHVPDADFDEGPEGPTGAPPPDDDDGPDASGVATISEEAEQLAEPVRERVRPAYSGRGSTDSDDQQYVTIGR
ncbi:hypothetical protein [Sphingomonas sp. S2-65]|uniref:hypothetical protein n=1 Tax=Sphingomonas sp. S2-65 TaxID=2903960 RepID=UPI001F3E02F0|nr:hypothetical protein [Sphingomonas sp. S2-65]UYY57163.1 hypothetical protein LZ586_10740 [Sphingomonas sp. S2-65]